MHEPAATGLNLAKYLTNLGILVPFNVYLFCRMRKRIRPTICCTEAEFMNVQFSDLRFLYGFLKEWVWVSIRFSYFLIYRNCKRLREFEEIQISRQSCRGDCEQQGRKLLILLFWFCPRIRPQESDLERGGGELTSASSPHHHPISQLIRRLLFKDGISVFSSSMLST